MRELEIVEGIAKAHLASKKARLNARVDEVALEKNMSVLEKAKLRARAIDAMDRGELVI
jgi:hypothetical protein